MSAQIISLAEKRQDRGLPEPLMLKQRFEALIDATMMLNPFAMMWLDSYGHAARYNTEPAVIYMFDEEKA